MKIIRIFLPRRLAHNPLVIGMAHNHDLEVFGLCQLQNLGQPDEHGAGGRLKLGLAAVEEHVHVALADARLRIEGQVGILPGPAQELLADGRGQAAAVGKARTGRVAAVGIGPGHPVLRVAGGQLLLGADQLVLNLPRMDLEILDFDELRTVLVRQNAVGRFVIDDLGFGDIAAGQRRKRTGRHDQEAPSCGLHDSLLSSRGTGR